ncbi:ATP-binding protein [Geitlerinema sp. P-1104]|uniref:ATP-binding protein n=1 Tax=Geitlerinema sp. P-1104 TaxID=2546230 RepID=UPI0014777D79|nr:ATP-binding protein [Geitlerinema sp. P-1104]NMG58846.1 ATP-binding protein [Geitlerinema sp. P-1104]
MNPSHLLKLNQGLLAGTALLGLGAIVTGALSGSVLALATNVTYGLIAENLGTLMDRLRSQNSDVLRNEDIAKAAGRTVGQALTEKISPNYSDKESLDHFANQIEGYWVQWAEQAQTLNLFETLQEQQLYQIFSQPPEQFTEYQVLPEPQWQEVVTWVFQQGCEKGDLGDTPESYQDVISELAAELALNFNKHFRQVLKDDANKGGKAFVGMLFDLHGATLAKITEIQQYLPQLATREDICRALQQLETGIRDELAQFRQAFQQYLDTTQPQFPLSQYCTAIIEEKTQDFVGRRFVFEAIRNFLQKKPKGYFVLEADPGVGKTAIMARLVQLLGGGCLTHFNIQSQGIVTPAQFLENICTQLIQGYNLNYPRLPERATEDGNVLARLLAEAANKLAPGQKLVVVVDALDEVDATGQSKGSNLLYLPDFLVDKVYFILSKRPQQLDLPLTDYLTPFDLMQYPAESAEDARHYAEKRYGRSPQIQEWVTSRQLTPEQFLTDFVARSENNFMYLRYVLNDIEKGLYESESLESLPQGLRRYYRKHWQLMGMMADPFPIDKVRTIYVLSLLREAVSRRLLAELTELAEYQLRPILREWEPFLRLQQVAGETRYTIYHASFSDFLREEAEESGVNLEDIKRRIADNFSKGAPL